MILKEHIIHNENKDTDDIIRFLNIAKEKMFDCCERKFDINLINTYVEKIIEIDGKINLLENYIEAYQYFFVFGYDDHFKIYDENDIEIYERLYKVTGKGKWLLDKLKNEKHTPFMEIL